MEKIEIQFTLFSAFYSPLIAVFSAGFLKEEGIDASWSISPPGVSAVKALEEGTAQVIQTAPSQAVSSLAKGEVPIAKHFAQINDMDGFFLVGREGQTNFNWKELEGSDVVLFTGGQPLAMFMYACHKAGVNFSKIKAVNVGGVIKMDEAFRKGTGMYVLEQGPFPQQLEKDGIGSIRKGPVLQ